MDKNKPQIVRHGEVILKNISALPVEAMLVKNTKEHIVAHSETGHHHIVKSKKPFGIYTYEGKTYLSIEDAMLVHEKTGKDVHTPHTLAPAFYEVIIKKSYNYYSKMMERVRD